MSKKWIRSIMITVLAATMLIAAGCQNIGTLNLNEALSKSLTVQSAESKQSITLELDMNEQYFAYFDVEAEGLFELLKKISIDIDSAKVDKDGNASLNGALRLANKEAINFSMQMDANVLVFQMDGAKQPFYLPMDLGIEELVGSEAVNQEKLQQKVAEAQQAQLQLVEKLGKYMIAKFPNPEGLEAKSVTETINNESVSLTKVSAKLNGEQLLQLAMQFVDNLIADEKAFKSMLEEVLLIVANSPLYAEEIAMMLDEEGLDQPTVEDIIKESVEEIFEMLVEMREELHGSAEFDALSAIMKKVVDLEVDLYFDKDLQIRKQDIELNVNFGVYKDFEMSPFKLIRVLMTSESWNLGGNVQVDKPYKPADSIELTELDYMEGYEVLELFDNKSDLYSILKNNLQISKQTYYGFFTEFEGSPIIVPGNITLVALRDIATDFDGEISYDGKTKTVTYHDLPTGTVIKTTFGSKTVEVNGKKEEWRYPTVNIDGYGYVEARSLAKALGGTIKMDNNYGFKMLTIERIP